MKKILFMLPILVALFVFAGCTEDKEDNLVMTDLFFSPENDNISLNVGDTYQITPSTTPTNYPVDVYKWVVYEGEDCGKVDEKGMFTALKPGKVKVEVITPNIHNTNNMPFFATCNIEIKGSSDSDDNTEDNNDDKDPVIENITFEKDSLHLIVGNSADISYEIFPTEAQNERIKWYSSNQNIISFTQIGNKIIVTAINVGEAEIYTSINNKKFGIKVIVNPVEVERIEVFPPLKQVKEKESFTLECTIYPENATNKELIFSSSDENIATVNDKGRVTAIAPGECIINVSTKDGKVTGSCELTVTELPIEEQIRISTSGSIVSINGYLTGSMSTYLYNNSNKIINVKSLTVYDTLMNTVEYQEENLGEVIKGNPLVRSFQFKGIYKPLFIWKYECDGKTYEAKYQTR